MDFYPLKGRCEPDEAAALRLECDDPRAVLARVRCYALNRLCDEQTVAFNGRAANIVIPAMHCEGAGYGVEAEVCDESGAVLATRSTAFPTHRADTIIRYGFLSDFTREDMNEDDVRWMAKCHIDHVQFYDWSYRHDTLVAPQDDYTDMMGKRNCLAVIRRKIAACHERGMKAMAYGAVYAASRAFWEAHPAWGMAHPNGEPLRFIDTFYLMNVGSEWREHLMLQYRDAIVRVGFDGVHMDTYGEPKRAKTADGGECDLELQLPALIRDTDARLRQWGIKPHLIFNNVGAWPVRETMREPQAAVYMEIWPPYETLRDLRELALSAWDGGVPVVLAAYPSPFRTEDAERALYGYLLVSATVAFAGATQLCLGEECGMLTQGYYVDYSALLDWQEERIRVYQDFFVRYQALLFDRSLRDVSMTHFGWDNVEYRCDAPCSVTAQPDRLWLSFRENRARKLITLVNLCGNADNRWNAGKHKPIAQVNISLQIHTLTNAVKVYTATPDAANGHALELPADVESDSSGYTVRVRVPRLDVCAIIWVERG